MVSQRNKPHKSRHRSKGKIKDQTKGKKVKDNFRAPGRAIATESDPNHDVVMKPAKPTAAAISATGRVQKRTKAAPYVEGVVRINSKSPETPAQAEGPFGLNKPPRSHRVAALIPLNCGTVCAKTVEQLRHAQGRAQPSPNDTQTMHTLVHNGCSVTFLDPFAPYQCEGGIDTNSVDFAAVLDTLAVADMVLFVTNLDFTDNTPRPEGSDSRWFDDLGIQVDALGRHAISLLNAIGTPSVFVDFHMTNSKSAKDTQRLQSAIKLHRRYLSSVLPPKILNLTTAYHNSANATGAAKLWRALHETKLTLVQWKSSRPYMLVDWHVVVPREGAADTAGGTLLASGYLRGAPLCPAQPVTLSGADTQHFAIESIDVLGGPTIKWVSPFAENGPDAADSDVIQHFPAEDSSVCHEADSSENDMEVDTLGECAVDGTLDDEAFANIRAKRKMQVDEASVPASIANTNVTNVSKILKPAYRVLKVPEGVSGYQAAWYDYDENVIADDAGEERSFLGAPREAPLSASNLQRLEGDSEGDFTDEASEADPDALQPVRQRFFKYRPLPSAMMPSALNTSAALGSSALSGMFTNKFSARGGAANYWDPYQNLPETYAKLSSQSLAHFRQCCKEGMGVYLETLSENGKVDPTRAAVPGQRITVAIPNISIETQQRMQKKSFLVLSGLLPNEEKLSLLHANLTGVQHRMFSSDAEKEALHSKDSMVFQVGFRRYSAKAMFYRDLPQGHEGVLRVPTMNENAAGGRRNQTIMETIHQRRATYHKALDLATPAANGAYVAHYGLITHTPVPVFVLQRRCALSAEAAAMGGQQPLIVSAGRALPPDPHVLILKKRLLIGKIYKVHQRAAVIKKMFLDDQDVKFYDKVELRTLRGVKGSIVKSIGTHGTFKAKFSAVVQQHDKVYIDLFKRVFPPGFGASNVDMEAGMME